MTEFSQGLSQEYWMKDESSKACYDCETVFTVFRRKHHCELPRLSLDLVSLRTDDSLVPAGRICGQIFCARWFDSVSLFEVAEEVVPTDTTARF